MHDELSLVMKSVSVARSGSGGGEGGSGLAVTSIPVK